MPLLPNFSICWIAEGGDIIQHTTTVSFQIMGRCFELKTFLIKLQKKRAVIFSLHYLV